MSITCGDCLQHPTRADLSFTPHLVPWWRLDAPRPLARLGRVFKRDKVCGSISGRSEFSKWTRSRLDYITGAQTLHNPRHHNGDFSHPFCIKNSIG